jgi:hypothetical protein
MCLFHDDAALTLTGICALAPQLHLPRAYQFQMFERWSEGRKYAEYSLLVDRFFDAGCSSLFNSQRDADYWK